MKTKAILFGLFITLAALSTHAQQRQVTPECLKPWGATAEDSLLNWRTYFFYQTKFENKQYEDAYYYYQKLYANVPCARTDIYIDARTLFDTLSARTEDPLRKKILKDSLYASFPMRIKHFGREGYVTGRWALAATVYDKEDPKVAYKLFKESVKLDGNKTSYDIPSEFIYNIYLMVGYKHITREEAIKDYLILNEICKANIALNNAEKETWVSVAEYVDGIAGDFMTCEQISEIFGPKIKKDPTNLDLKKTALTLLKAKRCSDNPLYITVLSDLIVEDPNEEGYAELANYYLLNKQYGKANIYLEKALENTTDNASKEKYYLQLAGINLSGSCSKARTYADKVLEINPNNGKAIMIKGHAVYNCNIGSCEGYWAKAMSWVAVDYMIRAKNADPSVTDEANGYINSYSARFPKDEEKFFQNHTNGQTVTIPCSGLSTTVR